MIRRLGFFVGCVVMCGGAALACDHPPALPKDADAASTPLFKGLGTYAPAAFRIENKKASAYATQGLVLSYAFNHAEAKNSFLKAAELAPTCAICYWGAALVLGPNINAPMFDWALPDAQKFLKRANELKGQATPIEQDLITALNARYPEKPVKDRAKWDRAYREAMAAVAAKYPSDLDVQTLYAEAIMDEHPWKIWKKNGSPEAWTNNMLTILESVIAKNTNHPGANHLYIHAIEASPHPEKALPSAQRLAGLAPAAGHMVHMPAHIFQPLAMYRESVETNLKAIAADDAYIAARKFKNSYSLTYRIHNHQFLFFSASLIGDVKNAQNSAEKMHEYALPVALNNPTWAALQYNMAALHFSHIRFGKWDSILKLPEPDAKLVFTRGTWHFARAMAFTRQQNLAAAKGELAALRKLSESADVKKLTTWGTGGDGESFYAKNLFIAAQTAETEIALAEKRYADAETAILKALTVEDELNSKRHEIPMWLIPIRHTLGAVYLAQGKLDKAQRSYRDDLKTLPDNGWSLFGLWQTLKAQNSQEAAKVRATFDKTWKDSPLTLTASRL